MKAFVLSAALAAAIGTAVLTAGPSARAADPTPAPKPAATQAAAVPVNKVCPVQGDPIDPKVTLMWNGKLIGFCCRDCVDDFKKDPDKYTRNLK